MAQIPQKMKFRKQMKGSEKGFASACFLAFGDYGMQALSRGRITHKQIEACRVAINRHFQRKGKVWIRVFPDKPVTKKPAETRMGKGKGGVEYWVAVVRPGQILFEVAGASHEDAQKALRLAAAKLGINTRFVERLERV